MTAASTPVRNIAGRCPVIAVRVPVPTMGTWKAGNAALQPIWVWHPLSEVFCVCWNCHLHKNPTLPCPGLCGLRGFQFTWALVHWQINANSALIPIWSSWPPLTLQQEISSNQRSFPSLPLCQIPCLFSFQFRLKIHFFHTALCCGSLLAVLLILPHLSPGDSCPFRSGLKILL